MSHLKSCSRCGMLHKRDFVCLKGRTYNGGFERKLRKKNICKKKNLEIKERAGWLCEVCRDHGIYTFEGLETHHIESIRKSPEKIVDDDNLICLCKQCHKQAEINKIDATYLKKLARNRNIARG